MMDNENIAGKEEAIERFRLNPFHLPVLQCNEKCFMVDEALFLLPNAYNERQVKDSYLLALALNEDHSLFLEFKTYLMPDPIPFLLAKAKPKE